MLAYLLLILIPIFSFSVRRLAVTQRSRIAAHFLLAMLVLQVTLGVLILLLHMPVPIAVSHQGGAIILLTILVFISRELKPESYANESV